MRDCLELLCFGAVTWWSPHLNGGCVFLIGLLRPQSFRHCTASRACVCLRQLTHKCSLPKGLPRSGSRRYSLWPPCFRLKVVGLPCRVEAYYCTGLQLMLSRELSKPAERRASFSLFCECIIAASFLLKCIRFRWSQVKCLLKTRLLDPQ